MLMLHTNKCTKLVTWLVIKDALVGPANHTVTPVPCDPVSGSSKPVSTFSIWLMMAESNHAQHAKNSHSSDFTFWQPKRYLARLFQGNLQITVTLCVPFLFLLFLPQFNDKDA